MLSPTSSRHAKRSAFRWNCTAVLSLLVFTLPLRAQEPCPGDLDGDNEVTVAELVRAVNASLNGCSTTAGEWTVEKRIDIPGTVRAIVADAGGSTAYVSTGTALVLVDLATRQATKSVPFETHFSTAILVDAIDPTGSLLSSHAFYGAGVTRLADLTQAGSLSATGIGRTTFVSTFSEYGRFDHREIRRLGEARPESTTRCVPRW
jgi:hypothetical protein